MKSSLIVLFALSLFGCSSERLLAFEPSADCVVFTNQIALDDWIEIGIRHEPNGMVHSEACRLVNVRDKDGKLYVRRDKLTGGTISDKEYAQIVAILDSSKLRVIENSFPPNGTDGWTWKIRRFSGNREIDYSFFCWACLEKTDTNSGGFSVV